MRTARAPLLPRPTLWDYVWRFVVLAGALWFFAMVGQSQPLGPHGEIVYYGFWQGSGGALHESLFSTQDCQGYPNPCASTDSQIPIDCTELQDGPGYARWAYGAICQGCIPADILPIIQRIPLTFPKQSDFDTAGAAIVQTVSWGINPHMACSVWREQLRVYFCQQTTAVDGRARCVANGYTKAGTPTLTPTRGTPTQTPTGPAQTPTATATRSSFTPTRTSTSVACIPGPIRPIGGGNPGCWDGCSIRPCFVASATPTVTTVWTRVPDAATRTPSPSAPSATPTSRTIIVPPRPTLGPPTPLQVTQAGSVATATPKPTPSVPGSSCFSTAFLFFAVGLAGVGVVWRRR